MNLDSDVRSLKQGEYRRLTNGSPTQPAASTSALQDTIKSLFGNAVVANADLPGGTSQIIGTLEDRAGNRAFFCLYNSTAANDAVYQYKSGVITRVLRSALFAFASTDFADMDIVGDLLLISNNSSDIFCIDITKAIAGATYTPAIDEITLIKRPPRGTLTWTVLYDIAYANNFVSGNYFQFFHRYIYEDGQKSVFGAASKSSDSWVLPATTVDVMGVPGVNQALAGTGNVDSFPFGAGGYRILLVSQTAPEENGIWVNAAGAWTRATDADTSAELLALNVYVKNGRQGAGTTWKNTNASAVVVGTDPVTFASTLGPNAIDIVTSTADLPATVKQVEYAVRINGGNDLIIYRLDKTPLASATHRFYNDTFLSTVPSAEGIAKWNDSIPLKARALKVVQNRLFTFNNTEGYAHVTTTKLSLSVSTIAFADTRSIRHFKDGGTYNLSIVFFDLSGRFVGGVHCDQTITIPYRYFPLPGAGGQPPYQIVADLTGIAMADIPLAAYDYAVMTTNITNKSYFLRGLTMDVYFYAEDSAGVKTYTKTYGVAVKGTALDISVLVYEGMGYTFNAGDKIIVNVQNVQLFVEVDILSQDGRFVFVRPLTELYQYMGTSTGSQFLFEIYTPKANTLSPFFEIGEKHAISNAGTGSRAFSTTSISPVGDVSSVLRSLYGATGASASNPFANAFVKNASVKYPFEAMNSYDKSFGNWVKPGGRSIEKSQYDAIQLVKRNNIRFGQVYNPNSNVIGLNTFEALDEQSLPIENGAGVSLKVAGEVLVAVQEIESTAVYVGQGFVNTSDSNAFLAKTDSVIGDTRRYLGGHGSVHQASVVQREGVVYFLDARKGVVVRRSQDGLTVISEYGKDGGGIQGLISALCTAHAALGANSRIIGGWDPQYSCYCLSFIDTTGPSGYTLYWHEKSNSWTHKSDLKPELWGLLGQNQLAFLAGNLWVQSIEANYNKFFGVQYNRRLEWEIAPLPSLEKIWEAIEVDAESIYATAGTNEDIVLLYQVDGGTLQNRINYLDFIRKKSAWRSAVFRNLNDASMSSTTESKYKSSHNTRGQSAFLVITYNGTDKNPMKSITTFFRPSLNSTP